MLALVLALSLGVAAEAKLETPPADPQVAAPATDAPTLPAPPAGPETGAPATGDATSARLLFITERLEAGDAAAKAWFWTWTAVYGAGTVAQLVLFFAIADFETKANMMVGAITTVVGLVLMFVPPFPPAFAAGRLRGLKGDTPEERAAKLARAEALLEEAAESERFGRAWFIHVGGAALSLAGGLVLGLAWGYWLDGLFNFLGGVAATELQIWTQPYRAVKDLQEYRHAFGVASPPAGAPAFRFVPTLGGLAVAGVF